ncbi:hypothetical protein T440DRAFT_129224 [Plenodomus tracheiphilus IPT5]|uniref:Secreted protein n=1 Tax=Plenodomus tracheiphilus IPT5 TaxID=1408161 RepID=A0A6A7B1Y9_9PLEO|nr:hypothetical protein T440DRAFT_129224 [Plenodomus tracheiphilus IPT5]
MHSASFFPMLMCTVALLLQRESSSSSEWRASTIFAATTSYRLHPAAPSAPNGKKTKGAVRNMAHTPAMYCAQHGVCPKSISPTVVRHSMMYLVSRQPIGTSKGMMALCSDRWSLASLRSVCCTCFGLRELLHYQRLRLKCRVWYR